MAQWLEELIVLAEAQDSIPSTHLHNGSQPTITSVPKDPMPKWALHTNIHNIDKTLKHMDTIIK